jgi:hypothetical protein
MFAIMRALPACCLLALGTHSVFEAPKAKTTCFGGKEI